jgi:putative tryptophan/tyrosine transport system substrate-binding protein
MIARRRLLIAIGASALAAPLESFAQQQTAKIPQIGFLGTEFALSEAGHIKALRTGLRELGYVEGKNIAIEFRWAEGKVDRLPNLAAELVGLNVAMIVTYGTPGTLAAKRATQTIPIVMVTAGDPVATGIVASLARPGGNITGSTSVTRDLNAKRLELLKEAAPRVTRVAVLVNPDNPARVPDLHDELQPIVATARALRVELQQFEARRPDALNAAFAEMGKSHVDGVIVIQDAMLNANPRLIAELAAKQRLSSVGFEEFAEGGGLIGYGADFREMYRHAAYFMDKILKGAKPSEIPVEQPTRFELIVNEKTAKALSLTLPSVLLLRADNVIH